MATLCRIALQSTLLISRVFVSCSYAVLVYKGSVFPSRRRRRLFAELRTLWLFSGTSLLAILLLCVSFFSSTFFLPAHTHYGSDCVRPFTQTTRVFWTRFSSSSISMKRKPGLCRAVHLDQWAFFSPRYRDFVMDELVNWFLSCAAFPSGSFVSKLILHNISWFHHFWVQLGGQTDYVEVDDQERWDTTRATISCSLRYIWLTLRLCIIHLLFFFC